jgi:hypothetical protein
MVNSITQIAAGALVLGIGSSGAHAYLESRDTAKQLGGMDIQVIKKAYGISDLVYDCVYETFASKNKLNVDDIVNFIENETSTAGSELETPMAKTIKECIYQDPFGWHGTGNEWAIPLLETESWN